MLPRRWTRAREARTAVPLLARGRLQHVLKVVYQKQIVSQTSAWRADIGVHNAFPAKMRSIRWRDSPVLLCRQALEVAMVVTDADALSCWRPTHDAMVAPFSVRSPLGRCHPRRLIPAVPAFAQLPSSCHTWSHPALESLHSVPTHPPLPSPFTKSASVTPRCRRSLRSALSW